MRLMLEAAGDVSFNMPTAGSALLLACKWGKFEAAELLVNAKAELGLAATRAGYDETPLHVACGNGDAKIAQLLVTAGADVNLKDVCGRTPLEVATFNDAVECAKIIAPLTTELSALSVDDSD